MQKIAAENNLSETAFFVGRAGRYHIRWFTPTTEVQLCGHATLASAAVIFGRLGDTSARLEFDSRSGRLGVFRQYVTRSDARQEEWIILDFPVHTYRPTQLSAEVLQAIGGHPRQSYETDHGLWIVAFGSAEEVQRLRPDFSVLRGHSSCVVATAPGPNAGLAERDEGRPVDFVSRYFAPSHGIDEDPVTGSAHCVLTPFWAEKLGKSQLLARQLSQRGGVLRCELKADRVWIGGQASFYLDGTLILPA